MSNKKNDFFWASYSDMMTSLFFIMLVLFVLIIVVLKKEQLDTDLKNKELEQRIQVFDLVDKNIKPLKDAKHLFEYEKEYRDSN